VRVIGEDGREQLGVFTLFAALNIARERGLDLVEVAPNSVPPVCRLMDYGRYKYEQQKKDQEAHRAQRTNDLKEVRMAPVIDDHDIETKTNMIRRFVEEGDKVKVTIQFRGAQMRHQEIGRDVLERILTISARRCRAGTADHHGRSQHEHVRRRPGQPAAGAGARR